MVYYFPDFRTIHCVLSYRVHKQTNKQTNKYVRLPGRPYIHTCRGRAPRAGRQWRQLASIGNTCRTLFAAAKMGFCLRFWPRKWGIKFAKMRDSRPRTPINQRAKFDAASFIVAEEIRKRTNETHKKTSSKRYIYTLPIGMCG